MFIGIITVFLCEYLDTIIKSEKTILEMFEVPVLGTIIGFKLMDETPKNRQ